VNQAQISAHIGVSITVKQALLVETVFLIQVQQLAENCPVSLKAGGSSANILEAVKAAKAQGIISV
jgi:phosphoheptose isomerase